MSATDIRPQPTITERRSLRGWWTLVLAGGLLGVISTAWQTVERISYAADSTSKRVCDINSVLSCGKVYSHWQSKALGIPNSLIGLPVFAIITASAVAALLGSWLSVRYLATLFGLTLFMTVFVTWYMEQTAFSIGTLCLFCVSCMVNITLAGIGLTRVVDAEAALGDGVAGRRLHTVVESGMDVSLWAALALLVAGMLFAGLAV